MSAHGVRLGALALALVTATLAYGEVFDDASWRPATLAAIALAFAVAAVARRLGLPAIVAALVSLFGLGVFATAVFVPDAPLLPRPEHLAELGRLVADGLVAARDQPAPAPTLDSLVVLVCGGAWLVAHLAHELQFRLRRPGLALIPVVVLWAVPLAMPRAPGAAVLVALAFLAAAGVVLLVDAHVDLEGWTTDALRAQPSPVGAALGAVALVAGITLAGALPGFAETAWWDLRGGGEPRGYQPLVDIGDRLTLPEPRDVLEVSADRKVYLRTAALDTFDRTSWRIGPPGTTTFRPDPSQTFPADGRLPPEVDIAAGAPVSVDVTVLDLENIYLPVPYQPVEVVEGPDGMIYSTVGGFIATTDTADNELAGRPAVGVVPGLEYEVEAVIPNPAPAQLRTIEPDPGVVAPHTRLPQPYEDLADVARDVYVQAGADTAFDRALALQNWFTNDGGFTYSTTDIDRLLGDDALRTFVLDTRVGYCEYFASAMAVMLRATDIPARVATGFAPGRLVPPAEPARTTDANTYVVSTTDAHAWVEVLFPGYGWIRFDPTPRSDGNVIPTTGDTVGGAATLADRNEDDPASAADSPADAATGSEEAAQSEIPGALLRDFEESRPTDAAVEGGGVGRALLMATAAVLLAVAAATGVGAWRRRSRRPDLDPAGRVLAAQRRLDHAARRYGVRRRAPETMHEATRRWSAAGRTPPEPAQRFVELSQAAAFGRGIEDACGMEAEQLADQLIGALRASVPRRDRLAAPVRVPVATATAAGRRAVDRARALSSDDD